MGRPGVAFLLAAVVVAGCAGSDERTEVRLRASGATERVLDRTATVVGERLDGAGIDADVVSQAASSEVVIRLGDDDPGAAARATQLATRRGVVELYDLEASLVSPSVDLEGRPLAYSRLFELLIGRQSQARADDVETWFLFDTEGDVAGGPAPTKELLTPGGEPLPGWRTLGVPPGTTVVRCGVDEIVCPGVGEESPSSDSYYLFRGRPALTGSDLVADSARQEFDPTTGEPIVVLRFTDAGGETFTRLTDAVADRGRRVGEAADDPLQSFQHVALVVDGRIVSWPSIDWQQYPNGIDGSNGLQITGIGSVEEARNIALALRTGALPVDLEVVSAPSRNG